METESKTPGKKEDTERIGPKPAYNHPHIVDCALNCARLKKAPMIKVEVIKCKAELTGQMPQFLPTEER